MESKSFDSFIDTVIEEAKAQYELHLKDAEKFRQVLQDAQIKKLNGSAKGELNTKSVSDVVSKRLPSKMNNNISKTFDYYASEILNSAGRPLYIREFIERYEKLTGIKSNNPDERRNFSAKLANTSRVKKTIISKGYGELPNNIRFWYGLVEWYDYAENDFKPEIKEKIMITADNIIKKPLVNTSG